MALYAFVPKVTNLSLSLSLSLCLFLRLSVLLSPSLSLSLRFENSSAHDMTTAGFVPVQVSVFKCVPLAYVIPQVVVTRLIWFFLQSNASTRTEQLLALITSIQHRLWLEQGLGFRKAQCFCTWTFQGGGSIEIHVSVWLCGFSLLSYLCRFLFWIYTDWQKKRYNKSQSCFIQAVISSNYVEINPQKLLVVSGFERISNCVQRYYQPGLNQGRKMTPRMPCLSSNFQITWIYWKIKKERDNHE